MTGTPTESPRPEVRAPGGVGQFFFVCVCVFLVLGFRVLGLLVCFLFCGLGFVLNVF